MFSQKNTTSKVGPLQNPPSQRGEGQTGSGGPGVGGGGANKPSTKPNPRSAAKPKFFNRISTRVNHVSSTDPDASNVKVKMRGRRPVLVAFLITAVSLSLLTLGIFMVYVGDEKYIVDVMVLGSLCIVMGVASFVFGVLLVLRPLYRKHAELGEEELKRQAPETAEGGTGAFSWSRRGSVSRHSVPSTSGASQPEPGPTTPRDPSLRTDLGDGDRDRSASPSPRGKLGTPPPPTVAPDTDTDESSEGTPTVFTATMGGHRSGEDVGREDVKQSLDEDIRALL